MYRDKTILKCQNYRWRALPSEELASSETTFGNKNFFILLSSWISANRDNWQDILTLTAQHLNLKSSRDVMKFYVKVKSIFIKKLFFNLIDKNIYFLILIKEWFALSNKIVILKYSDIKIIQNKSFDKINK